MFPHRQICENLRQSLSKKEKETSIIVIIRTYFFSVSLRWPPLWHTVKVNIQPLWCTSSYGRFPQLPGCGVFYCYLEGLFLSLSYGKLCVLITVCKWSCNLSFKWTAVWMPCGMLPGEISLCLPLCLEIFIPMEDNKRWWDIIYHDQHYFKETVHFSIVALALSVTPEPPKCHCRCCKTH